MPFNRWIDLIKHKIDFKIENCLNNEKVISIITKLNQFLRDWCIYIIN